MSGEAAIEIKQKNKKPRGGHLYNERRSLKFKLSFSYNGAKTATRKHSFKSSAKIGRAKGSKKKRTCRHEERRKKMNI